MPSSEHVFHAFRAVFVAISASLGLILEGKKGLWTSKGLMTCGVSSRQPIGALGGGATP